MDHHFHGTRIEAGRFDIRRRQVGEPVRSLSVRVDPMARSVLLGRRHGDLLEFVDGRLFLNEPGRHGWLGVMTSSGIAVIAVAVADLADGFDLVLDPFAATTLGIAHARPPSPPRTVATPDRDSALIIPFPKVGVAD